MGRGGGGGADHRKLLKNTFKVTRILCCWRESNSFLPQELLGNSSYHDNDDVSLAWGGGGGGGGGIEFNLIILFLHFMS